MSEGKRKAAAAAKVGRPQNAFLRRMMRQYGVTKSQVYVVGLENLRRMQPDARAVMFSTLRWEMEHVRWRIRKNTACVPYAGPAAVVTDDVVAAAFSALAHADLALFQPQVVQAPVSSRTEKKAPVRAWRPDRRAERMMELASLTLRRGCA